MQKIGISLGMKCDAAIWGVENGIRETKINGYHTCPFDEMLCNYPGMVECLKDNFAYFCDVNYLKIINTSDGPFIYNTKYKFAFNHESPGHDDLHIKQKWPEGINHFINNNFFHFIERYNKRIKSFREYLSDPNNEIEFILQRYNTFNEDLWDLKDALLLHYPNLKYEVHILYIENTLARKILQMLQFTIHDEEIDRLDYWLDTPICFNTDHIMKQNYRHKTVIDKIDKLEDKINELTITVSNISIILENFIKNIKKK